MANSTDDFSGHITQIKRLSVSDLTSITGFLVLIVGMLCSNFLMSLGPALLLLAAFLHSGPVETFRKFFQQPVLLSVSLVFLIYLLSGINSADQGYWLERLRIKIPFLLMPIAAAGLPAFSKLRTQRLLAFFLCAAFVSALVVSVLYLLRFDHYTANYTSGTVMPTPLNHIRYSLILAFAVASGFWLYWSQWRANQKWLRIAILIASIFILIFLHVLAVRSGMLAAYLVIIYWLGRLIFSGRNIRLGVALTVSLIFGLVLAFNFIPSLKNRVTYAKYDMEHFMKGQVNPDFSDAKRLGSIHTGWAVGKKYPVSGVGIGDIKEAMRFEYRNRYPDLVDNDPLPHNQFILIFASMGILGLILFIWSIITPLLIPKALHEPLLISFLLVALPSLLTENTFETQLGTTFYLTFLILIMCYILPDQSSIESEPR